MIYKYRAMPKPETPEDEQLLECLDLVIGVVSWISGANHHVFLVHPNIEPEHGPLPC